LQIDFPFFFTELFFFEGNSNQVFFRSLITFLTSAADLPFCLKGNLDLYISCGLKMLFGFWFFIHPLREKGTRW